VAQYIADWNTFCPRWSFLNFKVTEG
jgi:hypothetical protein